MTTSKTNEAAIEAAIEKVLTGASFEDIGNELMVVSEPFLSLEFAISVSETTQAIKASLSWIIGNDSIFSNSIPIAILDGLDKRV